MAKLLIQTPITSNGRDVVLDDKGQIRYRDTIVEDNKTVRSTFEKLNKTLPQPLRHKIFEYKGEAQLQPTKQAKSTA